MKRLLLLAAVVVIGAVLMLLLWRRISDGAFTSRPADRAAAPPTGRLLLLLPIPVAAAAMVTLARGQLLPFLGNAVGYGLFLGGALLLRQGLLSARSPIVQRWPLKTLGCALIALATGMTASLGVGHDPGIALAFALVALLGCYLSYGFDLKSFAQLRGTHGGGRAAHVTLAQASRSIAAIEQARQHIHQRELAARLQRIARLASAILRRLEADPRDMRRARRFLNVYLDAVQRVVEGYAKAHTQISAPELDERFRRALITVEEAFAEQQHRLLEADVEDLDVQIEVLTEQLRREGII